MNIKPLLIGVLTAFAGQTYAADIPNSATLKYTGSYGIQIGRAHV